MISLEELKEYARLKKLNLGQAEKEYFQNIVLFILYDTFGKDLVFKGGTALSRAYGLERFSEDLDFTSVQSVHLREVLMSGLKKFYLETEIQEEIVERSFTCTLRIQGPLYVGRRESLCKIEVDVSLREKILIEPTLITFGRLLKELPSFDVPVMTREEILAEKIRAIMTREKARDVYDLWFLLKEKTNIIFSLVEEKLKYYEKKYSFEKFKRNVSSKKNIWESELCPLLKEVPPFPDVKHFILEKMNKK